MESKYRNNVAEYRKAIGKTQQQLVEETGISDTHIQKIEYGDCAPTIYLAKKIARALSAEVEKLFPDM